MFKRIFLTGFQGAGKTTLGKLISKRLGWELIETDQKISDDSKKTIPEITKNGTDWIQFRSLEHQVLKELLQRENIVIDAGGGMAVNEVFGELNKKLLMDSNNTLIVLLTAPDKVLINRIKKAESIRFGSRPILNAIKARNIQESKEKLSKAKLLKIKIEDALKVLEKRKRLYKKLTDLEIDTNKFSAPNYLNNICVIIGDPIEHSLSPLIHNTAYKALTIDDKYIYLPIRVSKESLEKAIELIKKLNIKGISVTVPLKEEVLKYLNKVEKEAKKIGAVNTIVNNEGILTGYNTDWIGAVKSLVEKTSLSGKNIAVIGAGGSARAVIYGLVKKGAMVKVFNRSEDKAKRLAKKFGCEFGSMKNLQEISDMDIIVNATSVGMNEDKSPIDKKLIRKHQIVFDCVYSPLETKLLKDAKSKGAKIIFGTEMLLYQGVEQFKLYTGLDAPISEMKKALEST